MDNNVTTAPKLRQLTARQQHDLLRRTFNEDPYAFTEAWEDAPAFRAELETLHRNMAPEDAVADRRRLAMAAYYCGFQPGMFDYAYDNFEQFSTKANGGKALDVWDDFDRVAQSFGAQPSQEQTPSGFFAGVGNLIAADAAVRMQGQSLLAGNKNNAEHAAKNIDKHLRQADAAFANWETQALPAAWKQDLTRLSGTVYNFLGALGREYAKHSTANIRAELSRTAPGAVDLIRQPDEAANLVGNAIRSPYTNRLEGARDSAAFVAANTGIPENWVANSGSVSNWFRNAGVAIIGSLPSTIANLGLTAAGGPATAGILYGADSYYEALDEGMSEEDAIAYGTVIGVINGIGETVTDKLLKVDGGKTDIKALQKDIARNLVYRIARHLTIGGAKEGSQEALEQTAENLADMMFGRRGKITTGNWKSELFRNVPEAFVNAFATGFALEAGNYRAKQSFNAGKLQEYRNLQLIQRTIAELEAKADNLSVDESELLQVLNIMNDAGNPAKILRGAEMIQMYELRHTVDKMRQQEASATMEGTSDLAGDAKISPEEQAQSDNAARDLKLQRFLPHDVQDTENAVFDTMEKLGYSGEVVVMRTGWDEEQLALMRGKVPELANLPADVEKSVLGKMFPAFYHNGKVYINAQTVRPSEVPRVLAHEFGLHEGIRKAFSKDLNTLLDWVYDANFNAPELQRIIENYHLAEAEVDEEGNPLFDGEGKQIFKELSEANRRIAAEELLADLAENGGIDYRKAYIENEADIAAFAKENNIDIHNLADRRQLVKDWAAATNYTVQKPNWFKQLISNLRIWLHSHGLPVKHLSDDDIANIIYRSAKAARDQRRSSVVKENLTTGEGARFLAKPYYDIPFADSVDAVMNGTYSGNGAVFMRDTPKLFVDMGFSKLPIMTTANHVKSIYSAKQTPKDHNHDLGELIKQIPEKLENPLMVITSKTHPDTSVVVILELTDKNNNAVVVPILLDGTSERGKINAHVMTSAQGRSNAFTELVKNAVDKENQGIPSILYAQKNAEPVANAEGVQFPNGFAFDSVNHNITDVGLKVKPQTETLQFKNWFADSKVVDADGKPLVVYHGTNWDILEEPAGEATFSDKYRGAGSGDNGFFGRGFYFTFGNGKASEGEAGYYGKNVFKFYLSIQNPFYFNETLLGWNGKRVLGDEVHSVEIVNAVKLFPELLGDFTLDTYDKNGDFAGEITLDKYARMFQEVYKKKKFSVRQTSDPNEIVVESDPVTRTQDGHTWTEHKFSQRIYKPRGETDMQLLFTHLYLSNNGFPDGRNFKVEIPYGLFREFYGEPEFRSWLEHNGYDGVMQSKHGDEVVAFKPTQIKSATDNIGTFDVNNPDVRFTLNGNVSEEFKLQVKAMQACVGEFLDQDGAEYARRFKEKYGISIDPEEAKIVASLAISENKSARQKQVAAGNAVRAWEYFKSFNPLFDFITNFAGDNFKINPGKAFAGDEFTGTFITPEYRKYSVKRRQKPGESDTAYRKYLAKREKALDKVSGTPLDEVAQAYAREFGADSKEVAEEMIELLRHLNRQDIISQFKSYKDEQIAADNAELEALRRAAEDAKARQIEEEAATIIQSQSMIDADWVKANSKVYIKLQQALFPGQDPVPHPSQSRIEEINAAIYSTKGDASGFIEGFRAGREAAYNKYAKELKVFREKLRTADADRVSIAREADTLLRRLLPAEHYSKFARRVIALRDIVDEKARLETFDNLKSDILAYADIVARDRNLKLIHSRLDQLRRRSDTGKKAIGVRDEATQRQLDQIRKYASMSSGEIAELVDGLQAKIESSESNTADDEVSLQLALQFGAIDSKNLAELITAKEQLEELARLGKEKFNEALASRSAADEEIRRKIIIAVNGNSAVKLPSEQRKQKNDEATQSKFAEYAKFGIWENLNLWGMFDLLDANNLGVFDKLAADTHTAARNEDTINFRNADELSRKINSLIGSNSALDRADRILQWRKIQDKTGVFRLEHKKNAPRRFKYTYYELSQAEYLLSEYDDNPAESILQDYQAEAIRHQLANFDNRIRKDHQSIFDDGVTETLEKLAANEEQKRAYDGKSEESLVCIPTPDFTDAEKYEMKLSQMQALSIWLYSKQPTLAYKLHFNGIGNNTLKQLENFLLPEVKELGNWMVQQLERDRTDIGKVYEKLYFTAFPSEQNYFPAVFEHIKTVGGKASADITKEGEGNRPMAYTPGALKQRVFHLGEPVTADALTVFQNHRMMMNHFVTHGEITRQMRAIFNNREVRDVITLQHGSLAYKALVNQLEAFIKGGNINAEANRFYQAVYSAWVRSKMAANIASGIKQAFGFITYGQEIPAAALVKGSAYAMRHPMEVLNILKQSDYFNNRIQGGANMELRLLLDMSGQTAGKTKAVSRKLDEILSLALRYGDAAAVMLGGYATYKYHLDNLVARGIDKAKAHKQAILEMEMATERTQQSSKAHMLNAAQRSSLRAITAFKSNQILLMNKLLPAILKRDGKQIKASLGALAVSSVVMTAIGNLLRKGIDFDEYEWIDYLENFAADAMSGYGFTGALGTEMMTALLNEVKGSGFRFRGSDPLADMYNSVSDLVDIPEHLEDDEIDKVFGDVQKILTGVGMVADAVTPGNFVSGAAAALREARRWWRLFTGDAKRKPKKKKSWF